MQGFLAGLNHTRAVRGDRSNQKQPAVTSAEHSALHRLDRYDFHVTVFLPGYLCSFLFRQ
jgi:hypothetical protein